MNLRALAIQLAIVALAALAFLLVLTLGARRADGYCSHATARAASASSACLTSPNGDR